MANATYSFPASFAQHRMWFIDQLGMGGSAYNVPMASLIEGPLDSEVMARCFREIVRRHESLRTRFVVVEGEPRQVIDDEIVAELEVVSCSLLPEEDREAQAGRLAQEDADRPFDLMRGPLVRAKLLRIAEERHVMLLTIHHIICDGWSLALLVREISELYAAFSAGQSSPLRELPIQYADFSEWQRQWLSGEVLEREMAYWNRRLADVRPLKMPIDRPRPAVQTQRGSAVPLIVPADLKTKLYELSQREGATLYMTLLAAFQTLLYRYTGQRDLPVGSPVAGRTQVELERIVGLFTYALVLRTDLSGAPSFVELLRRVKRVALEAFEHQAVPFGKLVEMLPQKRDPSRTPVFQAWFVLQNMPQADADLGAASSKIRLRPFPLTNRTAKADLALFAIENGAGMSGSLVYNTDVFERDTMIAMTERFQLILEQIATDPTRNIDDLCLLRGPDRGTLQPGWRGPAISHERHETTWRMVAEHAVQRPNCPALIDDREELTYRGLNNRANHVARRLAALGVKSRSRVGVCLERGLDSVVAMIGVLKAGAVFVPLEPHEPEERLSYMLKDAELTAVVTQPALKWRYEENALRLLLLDREELEAAQSQEEPCSMRDPGFLACVLYRSGPEGSPEGVLVGHRTLSSAAFGSELDFRALDRVAHDFNFSRDVACFEVFKALTAGACVVSVENHLEPRKLATLLRHQSVTVVAGSGAVLQCLPHDASLLKGVRLVLCGHDSRIPGGLLDPEAQKTVYAGYGCAEWGGERLMLVCSPAQTSGATVKHLAAGAKLYLLDSQTDPVPEGIVGEIYIGGEDLAIGYKGSAMRTASHFVPDPFSDVPGARLYRSGDLARRRSEGRLELLGRKDGRVNAGGIRIETGEIEAAIEREEGVERAIVVMREEEHRNKHVAAYVVTSGNITAEHLRRSLRRRLPEYMLPTTFMILDAIPILPDGEVDRRALPVLPAPDRTLTGTDYIPPRTSAEALLAEIWSELLSVAPVSVHAKFFELGGDSLSVLRMKTMIHDHFHRDLALISLFQNQTIASIAKLLE